MNGFGIQTDLLSGNCDWTPADQEDIFFGYGPGSPDPAFLKAGGPPTHPGGIFSTPPWGVALGGAFFDACARKNLDPKIDLKRWVPGQGPTF